MKSFVSILVFISVISCADKEAILSYHQISSGTSDILYKATIGKSGQIIVLGGYVWARAFTITFDETVSNPIIDTFSNKGQFDLLQTKDGSLVSVGTDGYFFIKKDNTPNWNFHRLENWDILTNVIETENGFLASGGKSYEKGYMYHINKLYHIDTAIYFGHEISKVVRISDDNFISVGWGNIQRSFDGGHTWKVLSNTGDFYASCIFRDSLHGFVIGYNGSFLETSDGGSTFYKSRAQIKGNGFNSFRDIKMISNRCMIITGNSGRLWKSVDNGNSWQLYELPTQSDIYDIVEMKNGKYLGVGSDGWIAEFEL